MGVAEAALVDQTDEEEEKGGGDRVEGHKIECQRV